MNPSTRSVPARSAKPRDVASGDPRPVMGRPRSSEAHNRILQTTLEVLSEKGFTGLTINEICARAKVSRATFYRRWSDPSETVGEAIDAAFELGVLPQADDPVEFLLQFTLLQEKSYSNPLITPSVGFIIGAINANPQAFERVQQGVRSRRAEVKKVLASLGGPPSDGSDVKLDTLLVILSGLASNAAVTRTPLSPDEVRAVIRRLIA